jgi:outer membrane protein OmpA-like peptidoglycan-associated protein
VNTTRHTELNRRRTLVATAVAFTLVVACTAVPIRAEGADAARVQVATARAAHGVAANSQQKAGELQRQLDLLHAKPADRGLVLTLGDVLFTSGRADLKPGAMGNLKKLVYFLDKNPDRRAAIHGYTDGVGSEGYNQGLSERRANSVMAYLAAHGIDSTRLSASGMGRSDPIAGDDSGAGRQQNRRVEVIISNPPAVSNPPAAPPPQDRNAKMLVLLALLHAISGGRPMF